MIKTVKHLPRIQPNPDPSLSQVCSPEYHQKSFMSTEPGLTPEYQ